MQIGPATDTVVAALRQAASATGTDFHYLLGTAMRESSLKPGAQSATSSATGLFQFVDQTWLGLVKDHGAKYGLSAQANAIQVDGSGRYHAASPSDRQAILDLRKDPQVSALMAGEYSSASAATLKSELGRAPCGGELYAAHFLGSEGACKLIRASIHEPNTSAASLLPAAAASNKSVFFHADGSAKSAREVYDWAMRQPGADAPVRLEPTADIKTAALTRATSASSADIEGLLASVMNWQPSHNFFAPSSPGQMFGQTPSSPLMLTPGLLGILSES